MTALLTAPNAIATPFAARQQIRIPKGTPVASMHPGQPRVRRAGRTLTVTVHHTTGGHVDLDNYYREGRGYVVLPTVTWPGTGGYWQDVQVTPEPCEANGISTPALPEVDDRTAARLDTIPAYGTGYDNRWTVANA